jgi:hypothetical protein
MFQPVKIVMTRPCQFCLGEATYAPLEAMKYYGFEIFFCATCQAEYIYHFQNCSEVKYSSISLYTEINDKMYRWTTVLDGAKRRCSLWYIKEPGLPGVKPNRKLNCLFASCEEMPPVTPQNIQGKISSWLTFL